MPTLMTPAETAALLRVQVSTLRTWRKRRQGPPYIHLEGSVRYDREALAAWIAQRTSKAVSE